MCRALIGPSVQAMELSLIAAYVVTDTGRIIVVLAKSLEDWYKNWQKRRIENALRQGRSWRAEDQAEWNERRDSALARGEDCSRRPGLREDNCGTRS